MFSKETPVQSQETEVLDFSGMSSLACGGILKEWFLMPLRGGLSSSIDELANKSEGKQAKNQAFFFCVILCELPPEGVTQILGWIFPSQMYLS